MKDWAKVIITYEKQFKAYFGVPLRLFMNSITGFDVIAFDDQVIKAGDNESTADAVRRLHGEEAVELIRNLIYGRLSEDS